MNSQIALPHDAAAEEGLLGACVIDADVFHECRLALPDGAEEFYIHRNRWVWSAIETLVKENTPIDNITLADALERENLLEEVGGSAYLTKLITGTPSSLNAPSYAKIVHEHHIRRKLIQVANHIASLAYKKDSIEDISNEANHSLFEALKDSEHDTHTIRLEDSVRVVDRMIEERGKMDELPGIPTPWIDLNELLGGGAQGSDLDLIVGRPGDGKTTALLQIALHAGRYTASAATVRKKKVLLFSCEMPHEQITLRLLSHMSGIDYQSLRAGRIPGNKYQDYLDALEYLSSLDIYIDGKPGASPAYIRSKCEVIANSKGLDMVCVDSLNLMRSGLDLKTHVEVDYNATELKTLAREFSIPVWAAHQLNRNKEHRSNDSRLVLSDLREGGEQPADGVIFIDHEKDEKGEITGSKFVVAKQRNGPVGDVAVVFLKEKYRFENAVRVRLNK